MDQVTNSNDLQKAIDEITNNNAAPAVDAGANMAVDLGQPPVPAADNMMPPATGEVAADNVLAGMTPPAPEMPAAPEAVEVNVTPAEPAPAEAAPVVEAAPVAEPTVEAAPVEPTVVPAPVASETVSGDLAEVKKSALHELAPIIDMVDMTAEKRFEILSEVISETRDKAIVNKALDAAKGIADEKLKAESLLKLVEMIDTL